MQIDRISIDLKSPLADRTRTRPACTRAVDNTYFKRLVTQTYGVIDNFGSARL